MGLNCAHYYCEASEASAGKDLVTLEADEAPIWNLLDWTTVGKKQSQSK